MNYRIQAFQSTKKLQKFKKGIIDSIKCIGLRNSKISTEQSKNETFHVQQYCRDNPKQRVSIMSNYQQNFPQISMVKQRNSFPCQNKSLNKSKFCCKILEREGQLEKEHKISSGSNNNQVEGNKQVFARQSSHRKRKKQRNEYFDIYTDIYQRLILRCQQNDKSSIKTKSLLRINKKMISKKEQKSSKQKQKQKQICVSIEKKQRRYLLGRGFVLRKAYPNCTHNITNETEQISRWNYGDMLEDEPKLMNSLKIEGKLD